ncbi:DNA polymerase Y family protein [Frigoribacterium sp. UYMn621]|uniref:DNA polymerase Y family protein n=1 Tax=Frigoribacterium sp. UYMn621 TaxID=3156343 RepID=UPI0033914824
MRRTTTLSPPGAPLRTIVLWCPDWPITAALRLAGTGTGTGSNPTAADALLALIDAGQVFACSASARGEGVRRGLRLREAQARCPELRVLDYDPALDIRAFEPVLEAIEETMPGAQVLRPGTCAVRARGPARYYGGEEEAALWLLDALDALGIHGSRVGIADGPFTAEHAARSPQRQRIRIVPEGGSAEFLSGMPVGLLGEEALATLLRRLGIRTLGEFALLEPRDVEQRFGDTGTRVHALARGLDSRAVVPRIVPEELDSAVGFEPPLDRIDQVTFGFRASADRFIEKLVQARLVCTSIRVEVDSESGELSERTWLHPRSFTAADVVDRVRWQLQGSGTIAGNPFGSGLSSGIIRVRVVPESVDAIGNHEEGLWGTGHDERIHHGLSRVQSMLGHGAVLTAAIGGGRTLLDRQSLVAWGDRTETAKPDGLPWPGQLPTPTPGTVFEAPQPAMVIDSAGSAVDLDERGVLSGVPARFSTDGRTLHPVAAWAGPWIIDERWWDADSFRRASRFQVVDDAGVAWLLVLDSRVWWAEARYD